MIFRKKIRETKTKQGLYGNKYNTSSNISSWSQMGIIEKFAMTFLPIMMVFIFYTILEYSGWIWWMRLLISIGIEILILVLIYWVVWLFVGRDY